MAWTAEEGEAYLGSRAGLGMRFGLERISRLVSVLGMPQHRFASIHVVGTNGKSSVCRMAAALLEAHGMSAGAYVSPHTSRWRERVRIRGEEIAPAAYGAAAQRVAEAIEVVDRALDPGESVTQFEADAAIAFVALAAARVEAGVIEAGLGGRLDATNVLPSRVTVLTSIAIEHTRFLGDTELEIAAEKLAVLRGHSTLVIGPLPAAVEALARRTAKDRGARLVSVADLSGAVELPSAAPYLRRNFAVAVAAAEALLGAVDADRVRTVGARLELEGRMEVRDQNPPLIVDLAHNPAGAAAVAEALTTVAAGRPVIACIAVLADKDAAGIVAALAPGLAGLVATEVPAARLREAGRPGARARAAGDLAEVARTAGIGLVEEVAEAPAALQRARSLARAGDGVVLLTGSHYLMRLP